MQGQIIRWSAFADTANPDSPHHGKNLPFISRGNNKGARWLFIRFGDYHLRLWWGRYEQ